MSTKKLPTKCIRSTSAKRVKINGEHNRSATFVNEAQEDFREIRVDGCLIPKGLAADWILCKASVGDLIIELKGRDVGHALKQVSATLAHWSTHKERSKKSALASLIVCAAQKPQISAQRQRAEREFRRDYGAKLVVLSGNREHSFESFF